MKLLASLILFRLGTKLFSIEMTYESQVKRNGYTGFISLIPIDWGVDCDHLWGIAERAIRSSLRIKNGPWGEYHLK